MKTRIPQMAAGGLLLIGISGPAPAMSPAPDTKVLWQLVFRHHALPLAAARHCRGAGTAPADTTLGDYLSGFLAQLDEPGDNRIRGQCTEAGNGRWHCELTIGHVAADSENRWRWGVRFDVRQAGQTLLPETLSCIGAG